MALEPHYPSSPTRPPVEHLYFTIFNPDNEQQRFFTHGFGAHYAAAHWLQRLVNSPAAQRWIDSSHLELKREGWTLIIKGSHLEDNIERKLTKEEAAWTPPYPDSVALEHLVDFHLPTYSTSTSIEQDDSDSSTSTPTPKSKPGTKTSPRHRTQKPAAVSGHTTVAQIASELNMPPNKARQILRKNKITKPDHGWSYKTNSKEHKMIRDLLAKS